MLSIDVDKALDKTFEAFANGKRRAIIRTLSFRPATITQLADEHGMSLPAIHRHIRTLEEAKLIQRRKVGRVNFIALQRDHFSAAKAWMAQYHLEWGNDKESLENYITSLNKSK